MTTSAREISSQLRKLDIMEKLGGTNQGEGDILPLATPPDGNTRREVAQRLNDPESRLIDELFWFWPLNLSSPENVDEALVAVKRNDLEGAVLIWTSHEVKGSEANVSKHNLAILYHMLALDLEHIEAIQPLLKEQIAQKRDYWKQVYPRWQVLLNHEGFWQRLSERIREVDDPRLTSGTAHRIREGLPLSLLSINATLAVQAAQKGNNKEASYHVGLMLESGLDKAVANEALRKAVAPIRDQIKSIFAKEESKIEKAPHHADKVANNVINQTSQLLAMLDMLLPKRHPTLEAAHDDVALLILRSQIAFANKTRKWHGPIVLLKQALQIAASASTRQRIQENIKIFRENLLYGICWFCKARSPDNASTCFVKMHGNVTRHGSQVYYQQIVVGVPRCATCNSTHDRRNNLMGLFSVIGLLAGIGICIGATWGINWFVGLLTVFGGAAIGTGLGWVIGIPPQGVKPESAKNKFPGVKNMISEGWSLGEKPSGVQ